MACRLSNWIQGRARTENHQGRQLTLDFKARQALQNPRHGFERFIDYGRLLLSSIQVTCYKAFDILCAIVSRRYCRRD